MTSVQQSIGSAIIIMMMIVVSHTSSHDGTCRDYRSSNYDEIICINMFSVDEIPNNRGPEKRNLHLTVKNSTITFIPSRVLSKFQTMTELDLSNNYVETVAAGAFHNLRDLTSIRLDNNELMVVPNGVFTSARRLRVLHLSGNKIHTVENFAFQGLTELISLYLDRNRLVTLEPNLFLDQSKLKFLNLSQNLIEKLHYGTFDSLTTLHVLDISRNRLSDLYQYAFSSLSYLEELYFADNQISSIDINDLKSYLPGLFTISLDNNPWVCENLVRMDRTLSKLGIDVRKGKRFDVDNYHGIACINRRDHSEAVNESEFTAE